jgi:hypothetical protein
MLDAGKLANIETLGISAAGIEELLDANWGNQLPRPKHEEIAMLMTLAASACKDVDIAECEGWLAAIMALMSQTLIPHSCIKLDIKEGTIEIDKESQAKIAGCFAKESLAKQGRNRMEKVKKRNSRIKKKRKKRIQKRNNMPILVMDLPQLSNEITLADLRQWMRDAADNTAIQAVRKSPEINLDSEELLDAIWKSKEPRPTSQEMTALFLLSEEVGTISDSPDDWIVVILPLLSYPSELHPYIKLNLREASFQLDERIEVVDRRSESCTES